MTAQLVPHAVHDRLVKVRAKCVLGPRFEGVDPFKRLEEGFLDREYPGCRPEEGVTKWRDYEQGHRGVQRYVGGP